MPKPPYLYDVRYRQNLLGISEPTLCSVIPKEYHGENISELIGKYLKAIQQREDKEMKVSYKNYEGELMKLERCDNLIAHDRGWNLTIKDPNGAEITVKVPKLSDIVFSGAVMRFEE